VRKNDRFWESDGSKNWEQREREKRKKKYRKKEERREQDSENIEVFDSFENKSKDFIKGIRK
jgi:hypothetical protein